MAKRDAEQWLVAVIMLAYLAMVGAMVFLPAPSPPDCPAPCCVKDQ